MSRIYATTLLTVQAEIRDVQKDVCLSLWFGGIGAREQFLSSLTTCHEFVICWPHTKKRI